MSVFSVLSSFCHCISNYYLVYVELCSVVFHFVCVTIGHNLFYTLYFACVCVYKIGPLCTCTCISVYVGSI